MGIPAGLDAGLTGVGAGAVPPAAFDPAHPNGLGTTLRWIFRFIERDTGRLLKEFAWLGHVESYNVQPGVRMAIHATAGGYEVDIPEIDARGLVYITAQGNSGLWPAGQGEGAPDGMAMLRGLQQLFDEYMQPRVMGLPRERVDLEFINTDAPISKSDPAGDSLFVVVPHQAMPGYSRTARRPALYGYDLKLCAYKRRLGPKRELQRLASAEASFFQKMLGAVRKLNQFSAEVMFSRYQQLIAPALQGIAAVNDVKLFLTGYVEGVSTFVGYNMNLLRGVIEIFESAERSISDALGIDETARFTGDGAVLRAWTAQRRDLTRAWAALTAREGKRARAGGPPGHDEIRAGATGGETTPMGSANSALRLGLGERDRGAGLNGGEAVGAVSATITAGDTLDRLRPAGFTDLDVIRLNRLRWPFVDSARTRPSGDPRPTPGSMRVLYQGDTILLPTRAGSVGTAARSDVAAEGRETDEERLYGVDLYVNPETRALEWDTATGDLRLVGGFENLQQALRHLLRLPLGALHYAEDVGSHLAAAAQGVWANDLEARLNAIAVMKTLTQDPRVASVERVTVAFASGKAEVEFDLTAIDGVSRGRLALSA